MPSKPVATILPSNANTIIEDQLNEHLIALERELGMDVLVYTGGIIRPADDLIRDALDSRTKYTDIS